MSQLALNLRFRVDSSFENFFSEENRELVAQLRGLVDASGTNGRPMYLWGEPGLGKTHLLEAVCREVHARGQAVAYVPFADLGSLDPRMLEDFESLSLVCLDDIDLVAGLHSWERAVFRLWERLQASGVRLVVAAARAPTRLGLDLPDLATRLAAGLVYPVKPLTEAHRADALKARARVRGLELGDDVLRYLLTRFARGQGDLFLLLERLDRAALAHQRRVTIPFLRQMEMFDQKRSEP